MDENDVSPYILPVDVIPLVVTTAICPASALLTIHSMTERRSATSDPDRIVRLIEKPFWGVVTTSLLSLSPDPGRSWTAQMEGTS